MGGVGLAKQGGSALFLFFLAEVVQTRACKNILKTFNLASLALLELSEPPLNLLLEGRVTERDTSTELREYQRNHIQTIVVD